MVSEEELKRRGWEKTGKCWTHEWYGTAHEAIAVRIEALIDTRLMEFWEFTADREGWEFSEETAEFVRENDIESFYASRGEEDASR